MRVARYHEKGPAEVFKTEEMPDPKPGEGEVLLRIEAVPVTYAEVLRRSGGYYPVPVTLPHIPGGMAVGVVEEVGPGVDKSLVGQRVNARVTTGGYAELGLAKADRLRKIPQGVDPVMALSVYSGIETAGLVLRAGQLKAGETVFVPAATGGLGFLMVQLARLWGASKVYGAASSEAKRAIVAGLGAEPIDYTQPGWSKIVIEKNGGRGVDLAGEVTGGPVFYETLEVVRQGGRVVNYGNVSDTDSPVNPRQLLRNNISLIGFYLAPLDREGLFVEERAALLRDTDRFLASGELKGLIGATFPLEQAANAHRALETRSATGPVILMPNGR